MGRWWLLHGMDKHLELRTTQLAPKNCLVLIGKSGIQLKFQARERQGDFSVAPSMRDFPKPMDVPLSWNCPSAGKGSSTGHHVSTTGRSPSHKRSLRNAQEHSGTPRNTQKCPWEHVPWVHLDGWTKKSGFWFPCPSSSWTLPSFSGSLNLFCSAHLCFDFSRSILDISKAGVIPRPAGTAWNQPRFCGNVTIPTFPLLPSPSPSVATGKGASGEELPDRRVQPEGRALLPDKKGQGERASRCSQGSSGWISGKIIWGKIQREWREQRGNSSGYFGVRIIFVFGADQALN